MAAAPVKRSHLLLVAALLFCGAGMPLASTPLGRLYLPSWKARHEAKIAEIHSHKVDLVLLGDSITAQYEHRGPDPWHDFRAVWQRFYADRNAVNLGFGGDATSHLLWRMQNGELDGITPKAAIILIGGNNLGHLHWAAPESVQGIVTVVNEARRRLPHTGIVLISVLPSIRNAWVDRNTVEINASLARIYGEARVPGVTFVDVTNLFMRNGKVDANQFNDTFHKPPEPALHPTPEAQALMAAAIEPYVSKLMGDRPH